MHSSPIFLEVSIVALVLGLTLRATPQDALFFACRPRLLLRAFIATQLLIPLLVMSVLSALPVASSVIVGATLFAISPCVPLASQTALRGGGRATLLLASSAMGALTSVLTVPFWLAVVSQLFLPDATIAPGAVMRLVATLFVLPLVLALILRRFAPVTAKASRPLIVLADLLLLVMLLAYGSDSVSDFHRLGLVSVGAFAGVTVASIAIGHLAGGRSAPDRSLIAVLSGVRHPGLALLVAKFNFDGDLVLPAVLMSLLISLAVACPYAYWRQRRRQEDSPMPPALPTEAVLAPPTSR